MKISLNWLKEYVDVPDLPNDLQAFCDKLDLTGTGVEEIKKLGDGFGNIVTGRIIKKEKHPDSDHMWITLVDVGEDEPLQIVCGAPNVPDAEYVCVAKIGAVLPGNFKIKKAKLRGVDSCGMNCSERELGLSDNHDGIMVLPKDTPVGVPIADFLSLSDTVIDTEITPNRPDCLSVVGCAREIAAIYDVDYKNPLLDMANKINDCECEKHDMPSVTIIEDERCPRYTARLIKDVKVGPSPKWLVDRLNAMGTRSINNIVDATNYILFLFGQPLHAFDYDKLKDSDGQVDIVVRGAKEGENFVTLDDEERILNEDMTVISTPQKAVALAGVMGGQNSEVDDNTTSILLETATFSPAHTSRTSRNLGLISESSMRYERRVDDADIKAISDASAALIVELAGGKICSQTGKIGDSIVDAWPIKTQKNDLDFRVNRFQNMMGADIPCDFIVKTLENLGCEVSGKEVLKVKTPTYRPDLEREIDLYEEVLRIYGMDKIEATLPKSPYRVGVKTLAQRQVSYINQILQSCGLHETISYSFAEEQDGKILGLNNESIQMSEPVELINPMVSSQKYMRQSLIPGLLRSVSYNLNRGVNNISLYEIGVVFNARNNQQLPKEKQRIAVVLAGKPTDDEWNLKHVDYDFFDAKGIVENLLDKLKVKKNRYKELDTEKAPHLQPGRAAEVLSKGTVIGWIGEIHPKVASKFDIDCSVAAFELDLKSLLSVSNEVADLEDIPVYPGISVDVAFVVDDKVTNEMMLQRINSAGGNLLNKVRLFDVYKHDKHVGKGKKSMAYSLEYRDSDKTLKSEDVEQVHNKLVEKVCKSTGAEVRS